MLLEETLKYVNVRVGGLRNCQYHNHQSLLNVDVNKLSCAVNLIISSQSSQSLLQQVLLLVLSLVFCVGSTGFGFSFILRLLAG